MHSTYGQSLPEATGTGEAQALRASQAPRVGLLRARPASGGQRWFALALLFALCMQIGTVAAQAQRRSPSANKLEPSGSRLDSLAKPEPVSFEAAASGKYADKPISITGALVSQLRDGASSTVVVMTDDRLVNGYLGQDAELPKYAPGSVLKITGICRLIPGDGTRPTHLFYLEISNAANVEMLAAPSWFSLEHMIEILLGLGICGVAYGIRAAFLKWRLVNQTAWMDRSMVVARERSRILELISTNRPMSELLAEICHSTEVLLPGVSCRHSLQLTEELRESSELQPMLPAPGKKLYEVVLHDEDGRVNGSIVVTSDNPKSVGNDQEDIFRLLSELAGLAMRQSLLYRGLMYHSTHDPLTELPNRRLCESRLAEAIADAEEKGAQLAVIYIDINRFKFVNDKYGHKIGDLYLQQISHRLGSQLRPIDTLARIGGDEFVVIAPFPESFDRAYALTIRLEKCFEQPFQLEDQLIEGSASFGFARYPENGRTAEELTRHADHAMYIAKHETRISEEAHALAIITPDELELALMRGRFRLAYQPQFSATGRLTGMEALLRLDDPVLGVITPDAFISVAEKDPVIVEIGKWVMRKALQDAMRWKLHTGETVSIGVNVSVRQMEEPGYANMVLSILRELDFPAERLEVELIERSLMSSGDKVTHQLELLREAGVRISLDDFGTEQSCLSLLHKLPIDTIKLDRSFIRAMDGEPGVLPIIQAIVSMAHSLGKRVVAEAVEHVGQVPTLISMGKMDFQGYLLSRPIPSEDVHLHVQRWRSGIAMPEAFHNVGRNQAKLAS